MHLIQPQQVTCHSLSTPHPPCYRSSHTVVTSFGTLSLCLQCLLTFRDSEPGPVLGPRCHDRLPLGRSSSSPLSEPRSPASARVATWQRAATACAVLPSPHNYRLLENRECHLSITEPASSDPRRCSLIGDTEGRKLFQTLYLVCTKRQGLCL